MKEIILAGGCFWGVEEYFRRINGVIETEVCYVNGRTENPTYESICRGNTYFAEAVKIHFDESIIKFEDILINFFEIINPTSLNKQGNDVGSQYRSGIYYQNDADAIIAKNFIITKQKEFDKKIVTEVVPLSSYYKAEDYHQKYLVKNPNGYCHLNLG